MGRRVVVREFGRDGRPQAHSHGNVPDSEWVKWKRGLKVVGTANGAAWLVGRLKGWW